MTLSVIPLKKAMTEAGFVLSEGEGFLKHEFQMARDYLTNIGFGHIGDAFHTFAAELATGTHLAANGITNLVARVEPVAPVTYDPATGKPIVVPALNNSPLLRTDPTPGWTANTTTVVDLAAAHAAPPQAVVPVVEEAAPVVAESIPVVETVPVVDDSAIKAEQAAAAQKLLDDQATVAQAEAEAEADKEAAEAEAVAAAEEKAAADKEAADAASVVADAATPSDEVKE